MFPIIASLDHLIVETAYLLFVPLAIYILISGLDDLIIDTLWLRLPRQKTTTTPSDSVQPASRIAVFIPLWNESAVVRGMVEHNLAAIRHSDYELFIGCYPNDEATVQVVRELEEQYPLVHVAMVPHDGPTVKADCLNWIYQQMLLHEEQQDKRYDIVVLHDAEDLVHPDEFAAVERAVAKGYDMVQVPVLPLKTPWWEMTHGVYCDDFAECQLKDLHVRQHTGAFLPGCGVGTGFRREALEALAVAQANRLFNPESLTEDYENGLRLHRLSRRQIFLSLVKDQAGAPTATREYFPRNLPAAIQQRTRWILGNSLQIWRQHGWRGRLSDVWFLWRDRKGLWGNPVSLLCNLLMLYALVSMVFYGWRGQASPLLSQLGANPWLAGLAWVNAGLLAERLLIRSFLSARIYGWGFATGVPLRMLWANWMNFQATARAVIKFSHHLRTGAPLRWVKTEHAYPTRTALMKHKQRLGQILVGSEYIDARQLEHALATLPAGKRLGEHLISLGLLSEEEVYEALSLQQSVPWYPVDPSEVSRDVARSLPARVLMNWKVIPVSVNRKQMLLASPELPSDEMQRDLQRFTRMELKFQLITPSNFQELCTHVMAAA